ncbi:YwmB family TATA-box binding protein [Bacillus sp. 2205SS5-2]|uniref:YwmB family TATA-box binding protein n=1 Tax=Bacillus sp. 2205SS5-2 TaxID=3109031 RepID=UPI003007250F
MKKILVLIGFLFLLFSLYPQFQQAKGQEEKIVALIHMLNNRSIEIEEWTLYTPYEPTYIPSSTNFQQLEKEIKSEYKLLTWEKNEQKDHHIKLVGTTSTKKINEKVSLILLKEGNRYKVLRSYTIGSKAVKLQDALEELEDIRENDRVYFTLRGTKMLSKKENINGEAKAILAELGAIPVETLQEEEFVSVSAFTKRWEHQLLTANRKKMNMQIGIRKNEEGIASMTIGSPIILEEY